MLELYLTHGRTDPNQDMDAMGFAGPRLQGVIGLHQTYDDHTHIVFVDVSAAKAAHALTQWEHWETNQLTLRRHTDMIEITTAEGDKQYFGDWGLWSPEHKSGETE